MDTAARVDRSAAVPTPAARAAVSARTAPADARRIDLDVVRGVAILLAMGWHINGVLTGNRLFDFFLLPGHLIGWAGVDVFFVLSGFLIGGMIFRELYRSGRFRYGRFYSRRLWRLWPTLYVFVTAMLLFGHMPWSDGWKIALHIQNYFVLVRAHHLWSLAVEEHFYVLFSLLLPLVAVAGVQGRPVLIVLAAIMVLCLIFRAAGVMLGATQIQIQTQTQYRLDGLACGVLLVHLALFRAKLFRKLARLKPLWGGAAIACAVLIPVLGKTGSLGETLGFTVSYGMGAALLMLVYESGIERWARPFAEIFAFLGRNAYTLYLFHVPVFRMVTDSIAPHLPKVSQAMSGIVLSYATSIVAAWLVGAAIERPFMRLRDRLFPAALDGPTQHASAA